MEYNGAEVGIQRPGTEGAMPQAAAAAHKVRVLIVDDHAVVRAGFKQLIETTGDLEVAGEAGTAAAALALIASQPCDVMLLDISLPDASVLDTVAALRRRQPELPILIVSMHPEEQYAVNLLRAGASGFFSKAGEAGDLLEAIRTVAAGRKYVSASLAEALALAATGERFHREAPAVGGNLTPQELQVSLAVARGFTNKEVAAHLFLSQKTIETHLGNAYGKLGVRSRSELARLFAVEPERAVAVR